MNHSVGEGLSGAQPAAYPLAVFESFHLRHDGALTLKLRFKKRGRPNNFERKAQYLSDVDSVFMFASLLVRFNSYFPSLH